MRVEVIGKKMIRRITVGVIVKAIWSRNRIETMIVVVHRLAGKQGHIGIEEDAIKGGVRARYRCTMSGT